jgi:Mg-chelatase subunit ChlD
MTDQPHNSRIDPELEARIVALVLGEASDFERDELNRLVRERPELASLEEEIQSVHRLLLDVGAGELAAADDEWKLSAEKRSGLMAAFSGDVTEQPAKPFVHKSGAPQHRVGGSLFRSVKTTLVGVCFAGLIGVLSITAFQLSRSTTSGRVRELASKGATLENPMAGTELLFGRVSEWSDQLPGSRIVKSKTTDEAIRSSDGAGIENQKKAVSSLSAIGGTLDLYTEAATQGIDGPVALRTRTTDDLADIVGAIVGSGESPAAEEAGVELSHSGMAEVQGNYATEFDRETAQYGAGRTAKHPSSVLGFPAFQGPSGRPPDSTEPGIASWESDQREWYSRQPDSPVGGETFQFPGDPGNAATAGEKLGVDVLVTDVESRFGDNGIRFDLDEKMAADQGGVDGPAEQELRKLRELEALGSLAATEAEVAESDVNANLLSRQYFYETDGSGEKRRAGQSRAPGIAGKASSARDGLMDSLQTPVDEMMDSKEFFKMNSEQNVAADGDGGEVAKLSVSTADDDGIAHSRRKAPDGYSVNAGRQAGPVTGTATVQPPGEMQLRSANQADQWGYDPKPGTRFRGFDDQAIGLATPAEGVDSQDIEERIERSLGKLSATFELNRHKHNAPETTDVDFDNAVDRHWRRPQLERDFAGAARRDESVLPGIQLSVEGRSDRGRYVAPALIRGFDSIQPSRETKSAAPAGLNENVAETNAFSTFSLHVSDVSFKLARAALAGGQWPEAAKVRIEEFVNAFDYGDPMPSQSEKVACQVEQSVHPFLQQRNMLRVSMRTAAAGRSRARPLRLTLLLDNSGSMERTDRQQTVRRAFALLAAQLEPIDQVTLISFARQPRLLADRVSGTEANQLVQLIHELPSEGGTNIEAALQLAFEKALEQKVENAQNRVILLTDGAVNLGDANPDSLSLMVEAMRHAGISFDAAGISADGLNDEILEALTRKGNGRYYLLDSVEAADDGFVRQIAGALRPAAGNVKVQVEFNPKRVGHYKLLGFEKHRLQQKDFRNDAVDAAEMAAAEAGVAVYQFEAKPDGEGDIGSVSVRFRDLSTGQMIENMWPIPYEAKAPRLDEAAPSLRIAVSAALLAAKLRSEPLGESVELQTLSNVISGMPDRDRNANRVQQLQLMIQQALQINAE